MTIEKNEPSKEGKTVVVIHGGPRSQGNTATLLHHAEAGARERNSTTDWVSLYEIDFRGCRSCFACKLRGGPSYGRCAQRDGLSPVLAGLEKADALVLGSPIYFSNTTGATRSFLERLLFPWLTYTDPPRSIAPKRLAVGIIYTMGAPEELARQRGYEQQLGLAEGMLGLVFGTPVQKLKSFDTLQFGDYSKYVADRFDPVHKATRHREVFPQDCDQARDLGQRLAS